MTKRVGTTVLCWPVRESTVFRAWSSICSYYGKKGPRRISPFFIPVLIANGASG
ncbi:MAG: hypothetical protein GX044_06595 [Firmicutes bacterium]|nr:hypothetical protein [Bacillota bacterium]